MRKDRLDALLFNRGLFDSREQGKRLILAGEVKVDGHVVDKPAERLTTPSAPVQRRLQSPPAKSKFLAAAMILPLQPRAQELIRPKEMPQSLEFPRNQSNRGRARSRSAIWATGGVLILSWTFASAGVVSLLESSPHTGKPGAEAFDADLSIQVSQTDILNGVIPSMTPSAAVFGAAPITDGDGTSRDYTSDSTGASFLADGQTVIEWTALASIEINEIRVFGYGKDDRALMEYSIELNTGSGYGLIDTIDDGSGGPVGASNGTNLVRTYDDTGAPLATGVVGIRIIYQDNYSGANGAAIGEIDVIGTPYVAPDNDGVWANPAGGKWLDSNNWNTGAVATGSGRTARFDTLDLSSDASVTLDSSRPLAHLIFGDVNPSHNWHVKIDNPYQPLILSGDNPSIEVLSGITSLEVQLSGDQGFEKKGGGTLELNRPATYSGPTIVRAGTLRLNPALKVMPFGDSITYGGSGTNAGYRGYLYAQLARTLPKFQFEGASTTNPSTLPASPVNQRKHNGYASYPTLTISNNLDGFDNEAYARWGQESRNPHGGYWLTGGHGTGRSPQYPDIALFTIGTNDIAWGVNNFNPEIGVEEYPVNLRNLVDKIHTLRPDCHVIIGRITPWPARSALVNDVNASVDAVFATLQGEGRNVSKADLFTDFPANGLSADGLHPSDIGYSFMAEKWLEAIKKAVPLMLPKNAAVQVMAGAIIDSPNQSLDFDTLEGAGEVKMRATTLSLGGAGGSFAFDGNISGAGSITKRGTGTATLAGTNSYSGETKIEAGTLSLAQATLADRAPLSLSSGALLALSHNEVDTVGALMIDGIAQADGVYGSMDSNAPNRVGYLSGTGKIRVGASNYESWSDSNAGGEDEGQDFDNDHVPNGIEFFMGETGGTQTLNPPIQTDTITWPRDVSSLVAGFDVESSSDLKMWTPVPHDDAAMAIIPSSVSYTIPRIPPSPTIKFYRMKVYP